jgi:predicted dehydrogenase
MIWNPQKKIKIYDTGYQYQTDEQRNEILVDYRTGDINVPKIKMTEALYLMAEDFINSIENNTTPISNAQLGLDVVEILDAAETSIKNGGEEIKLN